MLYILAKLIVVAYPMQIALAIYCHYSHNINSFLYLIHMLYHFYPTILAYTIIPINSNLIFASVIFDLLMFNVVNNGQSPLFKVIAPQLPSPISAVSFIYYISIIFGGLANLILLRAQLLFCQWGQMLNCFSCTNSYLSQSRE